MQINLKRQQNSREKFLIKNIWRRTESVKVHTGPQVNLVRVIWKILYPDTKDASLVKDCLPEPPTPTSRALPRGVRIIRKICTVDNTQR